MRLVGILPAEDNADHIANKSYTAERIEDHEKHRFSTIYMSDASVFCGKCIDAGNKTRLHRCQL